MILVLFAVLCFSLCDDNLVFRVDNKVWYPINKCFTSGMFDLVDQIITIENSKLVLTQCSYKSSCSSKCVKMTEVDINLSNVIPNVFRGEDWLYGALFPNAKVLHTNQKPNSLSQHQFATVEFSSKAACKTGDFSQATEISYSDEDATLMNSECLYVGGDYDQGTETSVQCSCDPTTHVFVCQSFDNKNCTGKGTIQNACSDEPYEKQFCGVMDFTNSYEGVILDLFEDMHFKAGTYPVGGSATGIVKIDAERITVSECDADSGYCYGSIAQEFKLNEKVPIQTMMQFYSAFGGSFYAYSTEPLDITLGEGTDEINDNSDEFFDRYAFKGLEYYTCSSKKTKECSKNGTVVVNTYQDPFCQDLASSDIDPTLKCGTLKVKK